MNRTILGVIVAMLLTVPVFAQDTPESLVQRINALEARLKQAEQKQPAADPKEQAKRVRESYKATCSARGLSLKEVHIEAGAGGQLFIICK